MILKEGGNIFKDPETGNPLTQRVSRRDIDSSLDWVEKLTGLQQNGIRQLVMKTTKYL